MCLECHFSFNEDNILHELNNVNINSFSNLNSDDIYQLLISASGFNGDNIRNIAIELLEEYYAWTELNKNTYILPMKHIKKYIDYIKLNKSKRNTKKIDDVSNLMDYLHKVTK